MYQIKLFNGFSFNEVQDEVNKWLKDQGTDLFVISIIPSVVPMPEQSYSVPYMIIITIIYEE
jgi:hypothetical protein